MTDFNSVFSSFSEKLKPFGQQVGKSWVQVQQFAKEKMGHSDVTELPAEYRQLEQVNL